LRLLEAVEAHCAQDVLRLRELDFAEVDDLDLVAPRVVEIETASVHRHAQLLQPLAHRCLVVDDEAEVAGLIGRLRASLRQRDELVAKVDERHTAAATAQFEWAEDRLP